MIARGAAGGAPLESTPGHSVPVVEQPPAAPGWPEMARAAATTTLDRPAAWLIALAGFLARGGIVLVAFPILVLPTPTGISNVLAPIIVSVALTGPGTQLVALALGLVALAIVAVIVTGLLGAATDASLIRWAAQEAPAAARQGMPASAVPPPSMSTVRASTPGRLLWSLLLARLLAYVPLTVAVVVGVGRLGAAVYHELILPDDLVTPLVIRVIREEPWTVAAIVIAWIAGETIGGLAERAILLDGASVPRALGRAVWHLLRWPLRSLLTVAATLAAFVIVLVPTLFAAGAGWDLVAGRLRSGGIDLVGGVATIALVTAWVGGLVLIGAAAAWRSVLWTDEVLARRSSASTGPAGGAAADDAPD